MSKKLSVILTILCIVALGLSATALVFALKPAKQTEQEATTEAQEEDVQYVLYLGTNDKDTNQPVFSQDEAKEKLQEILLDHFGGFTIQEANGGWKDGDVVYQEYTLVVYLSDTTIDQVHEAADEMIKTFNQSSVLIQSNRTATEFYSK